MTDGANRRPLPDVQVSIVGTRYGALTNAGGEYRLTGIPVGEAQVRVRRIGYTPTVKTVTVRAGQAVTVDFALGQSAVELSQVVVTGTGAPVEQKKLGNTIATIEPPRYAPIASFSEALQGREPGVSGLPSSGMTGEGTRIRIRGNASLSQSNEPVVYLDGVRIDNGGGFGSVNAGGGGSPSRLDDIDPESIERIEVLKGAAAATLYGTEASNGVIQIFTKRGVSGAPRWDIHAERAAIKLPNIYKPAAGFARTAAQATYLSTLYGRTITAFQPFEVPLEAMGLFEQGYANTLSASVNGGSTGVTYFLSGRYYGEDGPVGGIDGRGERLGPAADKNRKVQGTANVTVFPRDDLRFGFRSMYADARQETPPNSNNIYAPISQALGSKPENAFCEPTANDPDGIVGPNTCDGPGDPYGSGTFATIRETWQETIEQDATHFNGALTASYLPMASLNFDATFGVDYTVAKNSDFVTYGSSLDNISGLAPEGLRQVDVRSTRNITLDMKGTWTTDLTKDLNSSLTFGGQGYLTRATSNGGYGDTFPGPGFEVVGAAGANYWVDEGFSSVANVGLFVQEQLGWRDWIFPTVGARFDKNSAFGENSPSVIYPKASLSVVASDMPGWNADLIPTLRLRTAIGKSGRQPGAFDKLTTFGSLPSEIGGGLVPLNLGNPNLKPEVATEFEIGSELGLFANRVGFDVTFWNRTVDDALVPKQYPVSGGFRRLQLDNIGQIKARGFELSLKGIVMNTPNVSIETFANGSYLWQKVTDMGGAKPIKAGGSYPRYRNFVIAGHAPGALFGAKLPQPCSQRPAGSTYTCLESGQVPTDVNRDGRPDTEAELRAFLAAPPARGFNALNVMRVDEDGDGDFLDHYLGKPTPDWQGGFGGSMTFLKNFKIGTLFEYKAGNYTITNLTDAFRSSHPAIGRNFLGVAKAEADLLNPASTADQRVAAAKAWYSEYLKLSPYDGLNQNEPGDFVRWRELSLTYSIPVAYARRIGARDAAVTFSGRNLKLWTKYSGDPEVNVIGRGGDGATFEDTYLDSIDAWQLPHARRLTMSVRLGF